MYDPKVRMMILISVMVAVGTIIQVLMEYVFGTRGFDLEQYISGTLQVGGALLGGFGLVWGSMKFITFEGLKPSGFEASTIDETGTGFNFPVSLSKYLPEIIAQPADPSMHRLEQEIIGFLNGFRSWPYALDGSTDETLYEHAIARWSAMKEVPNTGPLHRIAALSQDLGKVYVYKEKRKTHSLLRFWKRDQLSYSQRCEEHGGLSAFILSTIPSFRKLGRDAEENQKYRRILLSAIRYRDNPINMPSNVDPMVQSIYESLHIADGIAKSKKGLDVHAFNPTNEEQEVLKQEIASFFQSLVRETNLNPAALDKTSTGIYLGKGLVAVHMNRFVKLYSALFTPTTRTAFNLWQLDAQRHPVWSHFIDTFRDMHVLVEEWENVQAAGGLFSLRIGDIPFSCCLMLKIDPLEYPDLRKTLDALPQWNGMIEVQQDRDTLINEIKRKTSFIDQMITRLDH